MVYSGYSISGKSWAVRIQPLSVRRDLGVVSAAEVDIVKDGKRFILVVNPADAIKKKWRGRFKNGSTTERNLDRVRGNVR